MLRDLKYWETLLASSFMQRPHEIITEGKTTDEMLEAQQRNLESAFAFAALTTKQGATEADFYENIVMIPHYEQKQMQLLDKEDEEGVVEDNFAKFQQMYHPIWQNKFKDVVDLSNGVFKIDESKSARIDLGLYVNDNVYRNLEKFNARSFDAGQKFSTAPLTHE